MRFHYMILFSSVLFCVDSMKSSIENPSIPSPIERLSTNSALTLL